MDTEVLAHNYGRDNRQQAYRFFDDNFGLRVSDREIPVGADLRAYDELAAGVPADNLTILGLARQFAARLRREPMPPVAARARLSDLVRYRRADVVRPWRVADTWHDQLASLSYIFTMSNGLSATGVWLESRDAPPGAPLTIELNDAGRANNAQKRWGDEPPAAALISRDRQVLALNLLFAGDASPGDREMVSYYAEMIQAIGRRPLGLEAAQLIAIARWARQQWRPPVISVLANGLRSQIVALTAAALEPGLFDAISVREGIRSFAYVYSKPVKFAAAPELFCLDLYKYFDVPDLAALAAPTRIQTVAP